MKSPPILPKNTNEPPAAVRHPHENPSQSKIPRDSKPNGPPHRPNPKLEQLSRTAPNKLKKIADNHFHILRHPHDILRHPHPLLSPQMKPCAIITQKHGLHPLLKSIKFISIVMPRCLNGEIRGKLFSFTIDKTT